MRKCLVSGSFDPITIGHLEIIKKASKLFDKVVVGVFINEDKQYLFDIEQRMQLCECAVKDISNVEVIESIGMVCDYCKANDINAIIRGFRNSKDYSYETEMAKYNYENSGVMTYLLPADNDMLDISSSGVKKIIVNMQDNSIDIIEKSKDYNNEQQDEIKELKKYLPNEVICQIRRIKNA